MTTTTNADRAGLLFDYAVVHPDGFTNEEAMTDLEWNLSMFKAVARELRLILGEDSITLVCNPDGPGRWIYQLVGTYNESRLWSSNRMGDMEARLETIQAVARSMVNATDGRTADGRKAKLIVAVVTALRESLAVLTDQGQLLWDGSVE